MALFCGKLAKYYKESFGFKKNGKEIFLHNLNEISFPVIF